MSAALENALSAIKELSAEELLIVLENVSKQLRPKVKNEEAEKPVTTSNTIDRIHIPGSYRPTTKQVEALIVRMFTPEQLAEMDKVDLNQLPANLPSVTDMVSEAREDRF